MVTNLHRDSCPVKSEREREALQSIDANLLVPHPSCTTPGHSFSHKPKSLDGFSELYRFAFGYVRRLGLLLDLRWRTSFKGFRTSRSQQSSNVGRSTKHRVCRRVNHTFRDALNVSFDLAQDLSADPDIMRQQKSGLLTAEGPPFSITQTWTHCGQGKTGSRTTYSENVNASQRQQLEYARSRRAVRIGFRVAVKPIQRVGNSGRLSSL